MLKQYGAVSRRARLLSAIKYSRNTLVSSVQSFVIFVLFFFFLSGLISRKKCVYKYHTKLCGVGGGS